MDVYKKLPIELQDLVREKLLEEYRREHQSKFEETLSELLQKNKELHIYEFTFPNLDHYEPCGTINITYYYG